MDSIRKLIYLDNNATTPIDPRVLEAMMPFLTTNFANANSTHQFGKTSHNAVNVARDQVAQLLCADTNEIIFTSGATEAINLAILGVCETYKSKGKHIVTVTTEHRAVLDTCKFMEKNGFEVSYLTVNREGVIDLSAFSKLLRPDTTLVTALLSNNETGTIHPIKEMVDLTHQAGSLFMTDATQAVGKIKIDVKDLGVDLLALSGHKLYAPKGIGALYVRQRNPKVKLMPLIHGGGHERGFRSGTLNVPGIVALGAACHLAEKEMAQNEEQIVLLRDLLEVELLKTPGVSINGNKERRLYNVTNICFEDADSDAIIMTISSPENEEPMIAVSNGSACTSNAVEPSHVLLAMGLTVNEAFSSIRFSLNKYTTRDDILFAARSISKTVKMLREINY